MDRLVAELEGIPLSLDAEMVARKSRDFYWYSPILKEELADFVGDLVITPRTEAEVLRVVSACYRHDVPLTVRGAGTGNYGQCMPLRGGAVLEMTELNRIVSLDANHVRVEAGHKLASLEEICKSRAGSELRLFPSTWRTATVGGFIAGGSSGIGAVKWGLLRDRGNVRAARVVTMEAEPRILELRGQEVQKVNHGYGTTGIITELELALAPARTWVDIAVALPNFASAVEFAQRVCDEPGIDKRLCSLISSPIPQSCFGRLGRTVPEGMDLVLLMVCEGDVNAVEDLVSEVRDARIVHRGNPGSNTLPPLVEFSWNHTTLRALKHDPTVTYLQVLFSGPERLAIIAESVREFGDEVPMHLEFVNFGSHIGCFGLQLLRYTSERRLREIMHWFELRGCPVFDPHAYTLEDGGMKRVDAEQLTFKRATDPKGLLNPGKMAAWDDPAYEARPPVRYMYAD